MSVEIRVPPLGESLVDAVVGEWLKQEGESVSRGETVVLLETDKVNLDVTAEEDGVLATIARQAGETVTVGDVLGVVSSAGATAAAGSAGGNGATAPTPEPAPAAADRSPAPVAANAHTTEAPIPAPPSPTAPAEPAGDGGRAAPAVRRLAE